MEHLCQDLASTDCTLKSIPVTWPRVFDSVSVARIFFHILRPHWTFSDFYHCIYKHLDHAIPLEEYSCLFLYPTLGDLDNTWLPAQKIIRRTFWSNSLGNQPQTTNLPGHPAPRAGRCKGTGKELSKTPFPPSNFPENKIPLPLCVIQDIFCEF